MGFGSFVSGIFGGGGSGGGSNSTNTNTTIENETNIGIEIDLDELANAQNAQTELDREIFKYQQGLTELELSKLEETEATDKEYLAKKRSLELKNLMDDEKYKKYMLIIAFGGLGIGLFNSMKGK